MGMADANGLAVVGKGVGAGLMRARSYYGTNAMGCGHGCELVHIVAVVRFSGCR
jgi:hypothetical protein